LTKEARTVRVVLMRAALRRRSVYYALSAVTLVGGVLVLTAVDAPEWAVIAYVIAVWAVLMYVLRWRTS
jgi:hypothetical protein